MTNKQIGKYGEELAQNFLIKKGYKILETNFRYSKMAEIDIIAEKNNIIHFIEVKTRKSDFFGLPVEAINQKKLNSIFLCAKFYIQNSKKNCKNFQIDGIGIILNKENKPKINFIENISIN